MTEALRPASSPSIWLLAAVVVTLAPHATFLPGWLAALCAVLLSWRGVSLWQRSLGPHRAILLLIALAAGTGVKLHFGLFFGREPGVALLAVLLCLKLLEARSSRDLRATVLLCFFLQLALFLFSQTLPVALATLAGTLLTVVALVSMQDERAPAMSHIRTGGVLLAQGLPFMLVLFVLFPRISGPLWGLPADAWSGLSGLSDSMTPGSISRLGLSGTIAFRAQFAGAPPPPAQRYWRGPVLTLFDGRVWRPAPVETDGRPAYRPSGRRYDYGLTLEPHNRDWLLALDFPAAGLPDARYTRDFRLLDREPVRARTRYELAAYPDTPVGIEEDAEVLAQSLKLPAGSNPRSLALGRRLAEGARSPQAILDRILAHLRASALTYTLQPPELGVHTVDGFLFETRRGFCEHFSSSFVFLMRAAGVPARVVTGYQGGEINPLDGNVVVRQSDAHAWAEVWLPARGWIRVDPTALAAPQRIESGLSDALPQGEPLPFMMRRSSLWLRQLRNRWEAVSNSWNQSVLGYNPARQRELLSRLGFADVDWRTLAALLSACAGTLMLLLLAWAFRQHKRADPLDRAWDAFCRKLDRRGTARLPWEGPIAFAARAATAFPAHAAALREIATTYARLRYGRGADNDAIRALIRTIRKLDLK